MHDQLRPIMHGTGPGRALCARAGAGRQSLAGQCKQAWRKQRWRGLPYPSCRRPLPCAAQAARSPGCCCRAAWARRPPARRHPPGVGHRRRAPSAARISARSGPSRTLCGHRRRRRGPSARSPDVHAHQTSGARARTQRSARPAPHGGHTGYTRYPAGAAYLGDEPEGDKGDEGAAHRRSVSAAASTKNFRFRNFWLWQIFLPPFPVTLTCGQLAFLFPCPMKRRLCLRQPLFYYR